MTYQISDRDKGDQAEEEFKSFVDRNAIYLFWNQTYGHVDFSALFAANKSMWAAVNVYAKLRFDDPHTQNSEELHAAVDSLLAGIALLKTEARKATDQQLEQIAMNAPDIA